MYLMYLFGWLSDEVQLAISMKVSLISQSRDGNASKFVSWPISHALHLVSLFDKKYNFTFENVNGEGSHYRNHNTFISLTLYENENFIVFHFTLHTIKNMQCC